MTVSTVNAHFRLERKAEKGTPYVCATPFPPFLIKERNCAFQELRKHKEMKSKEPARICCTLQAVSTSYTDSQVPLAGSFVCVSVWGKLQSHSSEDPPSPPT